MCAKSSKREVKTARTAEEKKREEGVERRNRPCFKRDMASDEKERNKVINEYSINFQVIAFNFSGLAVVNVICSIVFGSRYDIEDKEFLKVIDYMSLIVQGFDNASIISIMPWLRFFPNKGLSMLKRGIQLRDEILDKKIKEHKDAFDPKNIKDFTDSLLNEFSKEATEDNKVHRHLNDTNFEQIVSDMFFSGGETTSTTILWYLAYLVIWPEVQSKVAEEMKEKLGDRPPCLKDRGSLPYLEATIQETLRLSSIVPLGMTILKL